MPIAARRRLLRGDRYGRAPNQGLGMNPDLQQILARLDSATTTYWQLHADIAIGNPSKTRQEALAQARSEMDRYRRNAVLYVDSDYRRLSASLPSVLHEIEQTEHLSIEAPLSERRAYRLHLQSLTDAAVALIGQLIEVIDCSMQLDAHDASPHLTTEDLSTALRADRELTDLVDTWRNPPKFISPTGRLEPATTRFALDRILAVYARSSINSSILALLSALRLAPSHLQTTELQALLAQELRQPATSETPTISSCLPLKAVVEADTGAPDQSASVHTFKLHVGVTTSDPVNAEESSSPPLFTSIGPIQFDIVLHTDRKTEITGDWRRRLNYFPLQQTPQYTTFIVKPPSSGSSDIIIDYFSNLRLVASTTVQLDAMGLHQSSTVEIR